MSLFRALLFVVLFSFVSTGGYAMIATMTLDELTVRAEIIAYAEVAGIQEMIDPDTKQAAVKTDLRLTNVLKGPLKSGDHVMLRREKGMEDEPQFSEKGTYLLFLKKNAAGDYETVNLVQGAWPVDNNGMYAGLGLGTTPDQLKRSIEATKDKVPPTDDNVAPEPEF